MAAGMNKISVADVNADVAYAFVFRPDLRIEEEEIAELQIILIDSSADERLFAGCSW